MEDIRIQISIFWTLDLGKNLDLTQTPHFFSYENSENFISKFNIHNYSHQQKLEKAQLSSPEKPNPSRNQLFLP